ncbi:SDR family NAD(P)-dependent oxidoreductase [Streptomyces sp. NPDC059477]|uniref:SDR family NAD(P)-dependent oxidoreductase n=1 Tax=Streptomyces sp. NPDC059477 TaxID=3346847 RepID=UPI0036CC1873
MGDLDKKVGVVMGAGPGIGRATALALAEAGAHVVVAARNVERLELLAAELADRTGQLIIPLEADLGDLVSCKDLIAETEERFGRLDILVNVATGGGSHAPIIDADWDGWRKAFECNVIGNLELSRQAARIMMRHGGGSIIQIGTFGTHSRPVRQGSYTATKEALLSASQTLAKELGPDNIRVNVVTPGYTTGPNLDGLFAGVVQRTGESVEEVSHRLAKTAALRTHVSPEDIAAAVLFLAGPGAARITGVELPVTAGQR